MKKEKLWYNDRKKKFDQTRQGPFKILNKSRKKEQPFLLSSEFNPRHFPLPAGQLTKP
jgi:hypothetical protein